MEIEAKECVFLEDGKHSGKIVDLKQRLFEKGSEVFKYLDVHIRADNGCDIKVGYPANISDKSRLGELLKRFGASIVPGTKYNPESFLKDKSVVFVTVKPGDFAEVVHNSLKPNSESVVEEKVNG